MRRQKQSKEPVVAYSMPLASGVILNAKYSANAWWLDKQKVHNLIAGFSFALTIPEACSAAGITLRQYKYFVQKHPEFKEARRGYVLMPSIKAQITIVSAINAGDIQASWRWLAKKNPEEFGSPSRIAAAQRRRERNEIAERQKRFDEQNAEELSETEKEHIEALRRARRQRIEASARKRAN